MTNELLLRQLYILRGQVDLLVRMAEGEMPQEPTECQHPDDKRQPASNMGEDPKFFCQVCKQTVPGVA